MWMHELTLIKQSYTEDELGNQISVEVKSSVFCDVKSVGRTEFYSAATTGLKPEIIFVIHTYEYDGETVVEFEGKKYSVIRTYSASTERMELTCEKVLGNG
jgi:SPP1 family predicted phage head-tail adaptor